MCQASEKKETRVLAFDLGASSGRAILGVYDGNSLSCEEIHRFENNPVVANGHLRWDFDKLLGEIRRGIEKAGAFDSVGFDTWGVDFGLLDAEGRLMEAPVHYRDSRTEGACETAFRTVSAKELYARTGNQIMPINTLFQLLALKEEQPQLLERADRLLFMPDLFAHALCGCRVNERTIASTSQLYNPRKKEWEEEVLSAFGLPKKLFQSPVSTGSVIGEIEIANAETCGKAKVIAVAGHDTQCAIASMPSSRDDVAFLSCGTWSLLGTELEHPVLSEESRELALSNEVGANGKIDYLKNIVGLWLVQECRRQWREGGNAMSFAELAAEAENAPALKCFVDPDAPEFSAPGDMPKRIQAFCAETDQPVPQTVGEICRCIYESLALKYRYTLEQLHTVTGKRFSALHVLGGGANAALLCQTTANACAIPVVAGPVEATALGNILIQLTALGQLAGIAAGRKLIEETQPVVRYQPQTNEAWESAYLRFCKILKTK